MFRYEIRMRDINGVSRAIEKFETFEDAMSKLRYFRILNPNKIYWVEMYF